MNGEFIFRRKKFPGALLTCVCGSPHPTLNTTNAVCFGVHSKQKLASIGT